MTGGGPIRVGIGGWTYPPWRHSFYPADLAQRRELAYAGSRLGSIEINATYYGTQKPDAFARWREETPEGFVFAVKAPRFATNRRELSGAQASVERFLGGGLLCLGPKLGPINWQFMPTKSFDAEDFEAFLDLLPKKWDGQPLLHAVEVRHESFRDPAFIEIAHRHGVAVVTAGDSRYPVIGDLTAPFVYARIMGTREAEPLGYPEAELDAWAGRARSWSTGRSPPDIETVLKAPGDGKPRPVFLYVISGFKVRNPEAALALIARLDSR